MKLHLYPDKARFHECARKGNLIPVCLEILADTETPVSALAKLRGRNGSGPLFLLESVEGGERWGRYSFLGVSAQRQIRIFKDSIQVMNGESVQHIAHQGDPLKVLKSVMDGYKPVSLPELPRFWGGLVGYFTYEMVTFFESIANQVPPDEPLAHFLITDSLIIFDNVKHTLTLVVHIFIDDSTNIDNAYDQALSRLETMEELFKEPLTEAHNHNDNIVSLKLRSQVKDAEFRKQVSRIKQDIYDGEIIQAVLSQPFTCSPAPDPWLLYRAQRFVNPSPYMFYVDFGDMILVGSSPETMVRLENRTATLRPIAGTRPRGATEQADRRLADDLLQDPKERAEHLMLVDLGRNDLGRVAETGSVQVTDLMVVERYSHVMHLVSNITCDLRSGCDAWALMRAAFPAGTLSGAPKVRAMEIIAEMEGGIPRGPYGGAVGYISFTGNMDLAITIRTALIQSDTLTVRAGAGIVADSDPEQERLETVNKAMAIQRALQLIGGERRGNSHDCHDR